MDKTEIGKNEAQTILKKSGFGIENNFQNTTQEG
jgi:hypothetical protein